MATTDKSTTDKSTTLLDQRTLVEAIEPFLADRRNAGLSDASIELYASKLTCWHEWRTDRGYGPCLASVRIEEIRDYFTYLREEHVPMSNNPNRPDQVGQHLAPATLQAYWGVLRNAWGFWTREGWLSDEQQMFFAHGRLPRPKVPRQIRPIYEPGLLHTLIACNQIDIDDPASIPPKRERAIRDRAILLLLHDSGMRAAELCGLTDAAMNAEKRQALITGKGDKQRYIFWSEATHAALLAYLAIRRGVSGGAFFRGVGSNNSGGALTQDALRQALQRLAERAGVALPSSAPVHALRHTFAHRFLDAGGDGLHLQQLMGHADIATTQRYVQENPTGLRKVYRRFMDE